jgi:hypothetical protein
MNELTTTNAQGPALFRASTDAAGLCREIVVATAKNIQGRKYVQVEGWQAIAIAHGCVASSGSVERIEGGFRAIGRVVQMNTGIEIATAEGFVGDDESMWAKRPEYARRAMAQTRAISRACRSAFAHVVVMMNAGLSTTPAEEVPAGGFDDIEAPAKPIKPAKPKSPPVDISQELLDNLMFRITTAETMADLEALRPELRGLSGEAKTLVYAAAKKRADEIKSLEQV